MADVTPTTGPTRRFLEAILTEDNDPLRQAIETGTIENIKGELEKANVFEPLGTSAQAVQLHSEANQRVAEALFALRQPAGTETALERLKDLWAALDISIANGPPFTC